MIKNKNRGLLLGVGLLGASTLIGFASPASAKPKSDKEDKKDVKEAQKEVREARKDVRQADTPRERRDAAQDLRDAQRDLEREKSDVRQDRRGDLRPGFGFPDRPYGTNHPTYVPHPGDYPVYDSRPGNGNGSRPPVGERPPYGSPYGHPTYGNSPTYGDRPTYGYGDRPPYGRPPYGSPTYGNRPTYGRPGSTNNHDDYFPGFPGSQSGSSRALEGIVTNDLKGNDFIIRTSNGQTVRVLVPRGEPGSISRGDIVILSGSYSGGTFVARSVQIARNR